MVTGLEFFRWERGDDTPPIRPLSWAERARQLADGSPGYYDQLVDADDDLIYESAVERLFADMDGDR